MQSTLLIFSLVALVFGQTFHGPQWQQKSAQEKQNELWNAVTQNEQSNSWPSALKTAQLFLENVQVSFDEVQDDLPTEGGPLGQNRTKLIHSVGYVALAAYKSYNNDQYTGLFKGSNYMMLRFSTGGPYTATRFSFVPAVAIKGLRSGVSSGNFFTMFSLEGQSSYNLFTHDLTNHLPNLSLNSTTVQKAIRLKFESASEWPNMVGLSDFAGYTEDGDQVASPEFPFRLILQPRQDLKTLFNDNFTSPDSLSEDLTSLEPGLLYYLWAEETPTSTPTKIGEIHLTTTPVPSQFGDSHLFFQHVHFEDDLNIHPEWQNAAQQMQQQQGNQYYFNGPSDLPYN